MGNTATVTKWGHSQGIRIPLEFCKALDISAGDQVLLTLESGRLVISRAEDRYTIDARLEGWNGGRFAAEEVDWGKSVGDEAW